MIIKYYGHAAFRITTLEGVRIIIDPYEPGAFGGAIGYGRIADEADIVLTSHDHADHNYTKDIKGRFTLIDRAGVYNVKGVKVKAIPAYHDDIAGKDRGDNLMFAINADGLTVAHLGDLGHTLDQRFVDELGSVDLLMLPVGGFFTIDAAEATKIMNDIKPSVTIPMHFKTDKVDLPIAEADKFLRGKSNVGSPGMEEIEITKESLPDEARIIVLNHAL